MTKLDAHTTNVLFATRRIGSYEELKPNLLKLRMTLNSSEYNQMPDVSNCINLINHLITETYQQYLDLKGSKTSVEPPIPSSLK